MNEEAKLKLAKAKKRIKAESESDFISIKTGGTNKLAKEVSELKKSIDKFEEAVKDGFDQFNTQGIEDGLEELRSSVDKRDVLARYKLVDIETKSSQEYHGYADKSGHWFIMRLKKSKEGQNYRYTKGDKKYYDAWRKKRTHTYTRFHETGF